MTTPLTRRTLLLGTVSLAGCQLAPAPKDALQPAEQESLLRYAAALNNMLMERAASPNAIAPEAFQNADAVLAAMKEAKPSSDADYTAFQDKKLQYAAVAASHAIEQGAGSLVVKIANVFPEITDGPVKIDGAGNYSLNRDLAANYGTTKQPDEPLERVQEHLAAIHTLYKAQFDDGLGAAMQEKKWTPKYDPGMRKITPQEIMLSKTGLQRT